MLAGVGLCVPAGAQSTKPSEELNKQTLVLPIPLPGSGGKDGRDLRYAISFGPAVPVSALVFSADGKQLFAGGYGEVLVWDLVRGKLARRIRGGLFDGAVRDLALTDDGKLLIVGGGVPGQAGTVVLVDLRTGKQVASFTEPADVVQRLAVSPDGQFLAAGAAEPNVYVWNIAERKLVATLPGHGAAAGGVAFSIDGKQLATGGTDRRVRLWDVESWKEDASIAMPEPITDVAFCPDGQQIGVAVAGPTEWTIRVVRLANTKEVRVFYSGGTAPLRAVWSTRPNRKAKRLYIGCNDNTVRGIVGPGIPPPVVARGHSDWVCGLAVSPNGRRIASGSLDGTVRLWNEADGRPLALLAQLTPDTDEWLVATPPGFLAASSVNMVQWRAKGIATAPADLTAAFADSESLRKVLAGKKLAPPTIK